MQTHILQQWMTKLCDQGLPEATHCCNSDIIHVQAVGISGVVHTDPGIYENIHFSATVFKNNSGCMMLKKSWRKLSNTRKTKRKPTRDLLKSVQK